MKIWSRNGRNACMEYEKKMHINETYASHISHKSNKRFTTAIYLTSANQANAIVDFLLLLLGWNGICTRICTLKNRENYSFSFFSRKNLKIENTAHLVSGVLAFKSWLYFSRLFWPQKLCVPLIVVVVVAIILSVLSMVCSMYSADPTFQSWSNCRQFPFALQQKNTHTHIPTHLWMGITNISKHGII